MDSSSESQIKPSKISHCPLHPAHQDDPAVPVPGVVAQFSGFFVIFKPVGWEIDDQHVGSANHMSKWVQKIFTDSSDNPLIHDHAYHFGFLQRLDTPSSGILLCAFTYVACLHLRLQLAEDMLCRQYFVV
eukprot:gnl/MRDRNA2_/MRDRNA2_52654_c0_seq1.p1 gnl/MRDRNA2_/MRDRNA2_52654_c0~~gnl/MRDRNA2_/MRDRNA2_52654_c0_seq1.p1  ORF type:complete len:150 (+),score=24.94 gnl/MRDRNA2_/MRDRNA2_52654_c0_seq1:62-451(+)